MADASDDDESAPRVVRAAPPPGAASPLPPEQEQKRRQVLARLAQEDEAGVAPADAAGAAAGATAQPQGGGEGGGAAAPALPGASKALTSLWGWGATLASKVEAAAASVSRELAETAQDAQPAVAAASRWAAGGLVSAGTARHAWRCMCMPGNVAPGSAQCCSCRADASSASSRPSPPPPCSPALCPCCSKAAAGGCAAEFRLGSTLGALSRTAQGLLEQAIAEVAPR